MVLQFFISNNDFIAIVIRVGQFLNFAFRIEIRRIIGVFDYFPLRSFRFPSVTFW